MVQMNENYKNLQTSYLFAEIARKVAEYQKKNPEKEVIKMGIGDVTRPLPTVCIDAMHKAVNDMGSMDTFKGYGPEQGYDFLRNAIAEHDFNSRGAGISPDEVFISDGAKCDTGNIQEIFSQDSIVAFPDPVYPVYSDTNVMAGRSGCFKEGRYEKFVYLDSTEKNNYIPEPPTAAADIIYLCFPNNPTGATADSAQLKKWVDYALENNAVILYDAAYEAFIRDDSIPRSIFEIERAKEVAIEFRSFSKTAGFTGIRCAYTVIPKECRIWDKNGNIQSVHSLWNRRHNTKFNGASYPVQRAAAAVFTPEGQKEIREVNDYYLENAAIIRKSLLSLGYRCTGGENSPYIWVKTGTSSWESFDDLLGRAGVVCTPGSGFGTCGEGYVRFSAFNSRENTLKGMENISKYMKNK